MYCIFPLLRNSGGVGCLCITFVVASLPYMSIRTGVIVAVAFKQVDYAPNTETGTESNNESLENTNCRVKKFHRLNVAERKSAGTNTAQTTGFDVQHSFQKFLFDF